MLLHILVVLVEEFEVGYKQTMLNHSGVCPEQLQPSTLQYFDRWLMWVVHWLYEVYCFSSKM
jgi:hypothetical protein